MHRLKDARARQPLLGELEGPAVAAGVLLHLCAEVVTPPAMQPLASSVRAARSSSSFCVAQGRATWHGMSQALVSSM